MTPPFPFHLDRRQLGMNVDVAEHISQSFQMLGFGFGVVAGVVLRGESFQVSAQRLHLAGNLPRRAPRRALEQKMLQEMRRAVDPRRLVPAAHRCPEADRHTGHVRHFGGGDANAVGQDCQLAVHTRAARISPARRRSGG